MKKNISLFVCVFFVSILSSATTAYFLNNISTVPLSNTNTIFMHAPYLFSGSNPILEKLNIGYLLPDETSQHNTVMRPRAAFFDNFSDVASSPRTIHFGGLQKHADAYLNLLGLEMGHSDNSGAILTVQDADSSFYDNRNGAGLTDGVLEFTKTNNNAPRLEAGEDILNSDHVSRKVFFTKSGFFVTPAFSYEQISTIKGSGRIRVYCNWKNGNITSEIKNALSHPNEYFGYLDANDTITKGNGETSQTLFKVMTDDDTGQPGWRTELLASPSKEAPGNNPGDTIDNTKATNALIPGLIWKYHHSAVFIGMSDHKFIHNDMAQFIPGNDSISREMTGVEYDLLAMQDRDFQYKVSGIAINANGNGHKLTQDSTDMILGGVIPHHLEIWDSCGTYAIESSGFLVPGACNTNPSEAGSIMGQFNGRSHNGQKISISLANLVQKAPSSDWKANEPALIAAINADPNNPLVAEHGEAGIRWNHNGNVGAISLCGGAFAQYCSLTVEGDGSIRTLHIILPWGSPPTSTSACSNGEIRVDENFIYVCVGKNIWHRTFNGVSW